MSDASEKAKAASISFNSAATMSTDPAIRKMAYGLADLAAAVSLIGDQQEQLRALLSQTRQ